MNQTIKNNLLLKGKRKTIYDNKGSKRSGLYGGIDDYKKMKSHVFADFQKEQFKKRTQERRRQFILRVLVVLITIGIISLFLLVWNQYDFDVLK